LKDEKQREHRLLPWANCGQFQITKVMPVTSKMHRICATSNADRHGKIAQQLQKLIDSVRKNPAWAGFSRFADPRSNKNILLLVLLISVCYACYTGFRAPSLWSINYYQISYLDGFHRRALLGTFLAPFGCTRFDYFFIQKIQFLVLLLVLGLFIRSGIRNKEPLVLSIFFLSSAGGYLFHEVGYIDQPLWLFAALAILALDRSHLYLSALFLSLSVMAHEMAIFTVLPMVLAYVAMQHKPTSSMYIRLFAPPITVFLLIFLLFQVVPAETIRQYFEHAMRCGHPVMRESYFYIFESRFLGARAGLYYSWQEFFFAILPIMALAYALTLSIQKKLNLPARYKHLVLLCCVSPLLLGIFGWDTSRWIFLAFSQVTIISLMASSRIRQLIPDCSLVKTPFFAVLIVVGLELQLSYFDGYVPRTLSIDNLTTFTNYVAQELSVLPGQ
jgi:hypothetical protein